MTNFGFQAVCPVIAPLVSSEKGSMGNRFDCAGAQFVNSLATGAKASLVAGTAAGVTYAAYRSPKVANYITKGLVKVKDLMGKNKYTKVAAEKITSVLNALSKSKVGKIGIIASAIALPFLTYIGAKGLYQMGQIDQKYTDKAKFQQTL